MSEVDRQLHEALTNLARSAADQVHPRAAQEVRMMATRRRQTTVLAVAAAVLAVGLGGYALGATPADRSGPPVSTSGPSQTPPSPAGDQPTEIPSELKLPHEGVKGNPPDLSHWQVDKPRTSWDLDPCLDKKPYPSDRARTDWRSIGQQGIEYATGEQLGVYPDTPTAEQVMGEFRGALAACRRISPDGGTTELRWRIHEYGAGDEGLIATVTYWTDGLRTTGASSFVVIRVGNAVFLTSRSGEFGAIESGIKRAVAAQQNAAFRVLTQMCIFAEEGC